MTLNRKRKTTQLTLEAEREGAYRINIVGEDPSHAWNLLVTGHQAKEELRLEPGRYSISIEDMSRATQNNVVLELKGQPTATVMIDDPQSSIPKRPSIKPSRPSRQLASASELRAESSLSSSDNYEKADSFVADSPVPERRMTLGLSVDTRPDSRGGWRPGTLEARVPDDGEQNMFALIFDQPDDWRDKPKWRLTIAVENDVACHVPLPLFKGGVRAELHSVETPTGPDVAVSLLPCSPRTAALVGGLKRGFGGNPTELVEWSSHGHVNDAILTLSEKMEDPWAAVAAALLLVRSGEIGPVAHWATNLAERFPWLADAGVVAAWAHAATSEEDEPQVEDVCLRRLVRARKLGSLYFSASNALAMEMLTTLVTGGTGANIQSRAQKELASWSRWTRRLVKGSTIVNWEETGKRLTSGLLPPRHYAILATGSVCMGSLDAHRPAEESWQSTELLSDAWDEDMLAYQAPEVFEPPTPSTFQLIRDESTHVWELSEIGSVRILETFESKSDALSGGALKNVLGSKGGSVEIFSHDGRFQEERAYPSADEAEHG